MNLYWGDIHNHCGITYGFGSLENALNAARQQLDFCAVTGHAMWPDMPERTKDTEFLIDFHTKGFNKLKNNWKNVRNTIKNANVPHEFVTFQSYEMHSSKYGDHHVISPSDELPLIEANSPSELIKALKPYPAIAVLHHVGYTPGYRGANWDMFSSKITPIVEVYSKHGCGMSDQSLYPYLHTMGPRDSRSTIYSGLLNGCKFGFVGSTDHHAGYPGSYGDGRVAVLAKEKTRKAIWEAMLNRRTYAVTGDKIKCNFKINGEYFGSEIKAYGNREVYLDIAACDAIDKIIVYKNLKPWRVISGENMITDNDLSCMYKIRVEMGWGNSNDGYNWNGSITVKNGSLLSVEPCFKGRSVLAPTPEMKNNQNINLLDNKIIEQTKTNVMWKCTTFKNLTTMHSQTNALILEVNGSENSILDVDINGKKILVSIRELLLGSYSTHMRPYNSHAVLIHRAIPQNQYKFHGEWVDKIKENECDIYHVEVRQINNQLCWISPVFVHS